MLCCWFLFMYLFLTEKCYKIPGICGAVFARLGQKRVSGEACLECCCAWCCYPCSRHRILFILGWQHIVWWLNNGMCFAVGSVVTVKGWAYSACKWVSGIASGGFGLGNAHVWLKTGWEEGKQHYSYVVLQLRHLLFLSSALLLVSSTFSDPFWQCR